MANLSHPCILKIYGYNSSFVLEDNDNKKVYPSLLLSYQPKTLEDGIKDLINTEKVIIIIEIVLGMRYIQEKCQLIRRDLKPSNILLTTKNHVRISDFGVSTESSKDTTLTRGVGTMQFSA